MFVNPPADEIAELLRSAHTIAVVGLSADPTRPSHGVARALQRFGYRIIPVTPSAEAILGETAVPSLDQLGEVLDPDEHVDIVDVFRRPEHVAADRRGLHSPEDPGTVAAGRGGRPDLRPGGHERRHLHRHGPLSVPRPRGAAVDRWKKGGALARQALRYPWQPMRIDFTKMHGVGNDFAVFEAPAAGGLLAPERVRALADRRTGIGFDQALVLEARAARGQRTLLPGLQLPTATRSSSAATVRAASPRSSIAAAGAARAPSRSRVRRAWCMPAQPAGAGSRSTWGCPTSIRAHCRSRRPPRRTVTRWRSPAAGLRLAQFPSAILMRCSPSSRWTRPRSRLWVRRSSVIHASRSG